MVYSALRKIMDVKREAGARMYRDTIVAISTPVGAGGIGIVRLSGNDSGPIVRGLFDREISRRRLVCGHIKDPETGDIVDETLVAYMAAPHTYTREDVVEINCHGGPVPVQRVLELCLRSGARLANPGEFTLRAFLNGRIDLAQAESVADIIEARTEAGQRLAMLGLAGRLSEPVRDLRASLLSVLAYLSARADFPDDEIEKQEIGGPLAEARRKLNGLIAGADAGMVIRHGLRTAIVGRPNVGKSSLLNCLLRHDRAIVTPMPGTTRDTLEEVASIKGVPFILIDTAGIARGRDLAEEMGIERSRKAIAQADFVLLVLDASEPLTRADLDIMAFLDSKKVLAVANKRDLRQQADLDHLRWPVVRTSTITREGIGDLESRMAGSVLSGGIAASDCSLVANSRHKEALQRAERHVAQAEAVVRNGRAEDLAAIDLHAALAALGEITGETVTGDLLDAIFSRFCIGK